MLASFSERTSCPCASSRWSVMRLSRSARGGGKRQKKGGGGKPPAARQRSPQGRRLFTGGRASRDRRCQRRRVDEDRARHQRGREVVVRDRHGPAAATGREADDAEVVPGRDAEVDRTRGGRRGARGGRGVLDRVGEIRLFGGHQVPKVRLHRGDRKSVV